jgi:ABC-type lipoprotein export system ATPase subunit
MVGKSSPGKSTLLYLYQQWIRITKKYFFDLAKFNSQTKEELAVIRNEK